MAETRNAMFFLLRRRSLSPPACGCAEAPWEGYIMDSMGVFGSAEGEGLLYWHHLGCPEICGLFHNHDEYSCPMMKLKHGGFAANMVSTAQLSFSTSFPPSNFFQDFCQSSIQAIAFTMEI
ncbi:hypothetical protein Ahy_B03g066762 isoform H [Arachis hypogaea]|uniref:Uncharacterized protein n=1 Tax=Arachis hypogaea TaxID=3818 RepID=A0A445A538_ARAHY|nr:hypothetical protein Ahy_B03g066762 isoform H [Arachis hypogaea]